MHRICTKYALNTHRICTEYAYNIKLRNVSECSLQLSASVTSVQTTENQRLYSFTFAFKVLLCRTRRFNTKPQVSSL